MDSTAIMRFAFSVAFLFMAMPVASSQNLDKHQWKNRILVVIADGMESDLMMEQRDLLQGLNKELEERKLIIYEVLPWKYNLNGGPWVDDASLFNKFSGQKPFEVLLIGLDGGIKRRANVPLTPRELFGLIDSMPMRRAEMRYNH